MKTLLVILGSSLFATASYASTLSCQELNQAYLADQMNEGPYVCKDSDEACKSRQLEQLKLTIRNFTDESPSGSFEKLKKKYQAYFTTYFVGTTVFESVNIDLGDNGFELFFVGGTTQDSGIQSADGDISVDGKSCKENFEFEPVMNDVRRLNLCSGIVPLVRAKLPSTKFNLNACLSRTPVTPGSSNTTNFTVGNFDENSLELTVGRNLHDFKSGYFSCTASLNRKTNDVTSLECEVN